jgi:AraC family transcriptional regulator, chitin signaling transcriptional activator
MLFFCGTLAVFAQSFPEKGVPVLQGFTPAQYQEKGKIWDIRSAPNGMLYMAADKGLLEYDGKTWNSFKGSNGFTRSLQVVNDSLIFTGSDLDFGVWRKNSRQGFEYASLYPYQELVHDENEEFWEVHQLQDDILFVSSQNIYVYKSQQLVKIAAPSRFTGSFWADGALYFADEQSGLFAFDGFSLERVFEYPENARLQISGLYRHAGGLVIVTRDLGLYFYVSGSLNKLDNALSEKLKTAKVFSFERLGDSHLAFGTVLKGLYVADLEGNLIHHVNRHKGLPSNTVLSLHYSPSGKLWMGMDYGVSWLDLQNNFTVFYDYRGDFGTGYTALLSDDVFYLGTNQGLYRSKWEELNNDLEFFRFQLVSQTEGQVWTLEKIGDAVLMGHDKGLFIVAENALEKLGDQEGVWTIVPYKDFLLTGNYNGVSIFRKENGKWTFWKKMDLISGSCNQLIVEKENILWVNIPNFGLIRAELDEDLNPADRLIFPENTFEGNNPSILKDEGGGGVRLVTDRFQYAFNAGGKQFVRSGQTKPFPEVDGLLSGVYQPRALHSDYEFYPIYNGFALKYRKYAGEAEGRKYTLVFRKLEAFNNENRVGVFAGAKTPYAMNNFRIEYIVPNRDDVLYQYKLNESGQWSSWTPDHAIELIGLAQGEYTFSVRALINGETTEANSISFRIAPPWHRSWPAIAFYVALAATTAYAVHRWRKISLKKQKEKLLHKEQESLRLQAEKHTEEIFLLEQERMQAEYDQLKQQLKNKTIELAAKARENEEKNRLLLALKEKCELVQANPSASQVKWREMQRLLDSYLEADDKTFEIQMDELHQEFFKTLKAQFPGLSSNDLRMCAYLKIGLNSREIAEILNIQPSSFYISRSRLRKKLNLKAEENLFDFLNGV